MYEMYALVRGGGGSGRVLDDLNKKQIHLTCVFSLGKQS